MTRDALFGSVTTHVASLVDQLPYLRVLHEIVRRGCGALLAGMANLFFNGDVLVPPANRSGKCS
jgi:hypothetical protein